MVKLHVQCRAFLNFPSVGPFKQVKKEAEGSHRKVMSCNHGHGMSLMYDRNPQTKVGCAMGLIQIY